MKHFIFEGTKTSFIKFLTETATSEQKKDIEAGATLIASNASQMEREEAKDAYLYVNRTFFPMSNVNGEFDPSQYEVLNREILDAEEYPGASEKNDRDLVTKGYLDKHTSFTELN